MRGVSPGARPVPAHVTAHVPVPCTGPLTNQAEVRVITSVRVGSRIVGPWPWQHTGSRDVRIGPWMRAAMSRRPTPSQTVLLLRPQEVIPVLDDDRPFVTPVDSPGLAGAALARLWGEVGLPEAALAHVEFTGTDPVLPPPRLQWAAQPRQASARRLSRPANSGPNAAAPVRRSVSRCAPRRLSSAASVTEQRRKAPRFSHGDIRRELCPLTG